MMLHHILACWNGHRFDDFAHNHPATAAVCGAAVAGLNGVQAVRALTRNRPRDTALFVLGIDLGVVLFCEAVWPLHRTLERGCIYLSLLLTFYLTIIPACNKVVRFLAPRLSNPSL